MADTTQTIEITNLGGRLTRVINGDLNSGFAKFSTSYGYDPFSKPNNLTWYEQPTDLDSGAATITDLILASKSRYEGGSLFIYAIGHTGRLYKIQTNSITNANLDSITLVATLSVNSPSFTFGASIDFFGTTEKIYIGSDAFVTSINFDGTSEAVVGSAGSYTSNVPHILLQFVGNLYTSNKNNLVEIAPGGTVNTYTKLSPGIPQEQFITDLELSPDFNYLTITCSGTPAENITTISSDRQNSLSSPGFLYKWNGTDTGITAGITVPSFALTSTQTFLDSQFFFAADSYGSSVSQNNKKIITLDNNKSVLAKGVLGNGNFLSFVAVESVDSTLKASMYYYGNLDSENNPGLWRLFRQASTQASGFIYQTPWNALANNKYSTVNNAVTAVVVLGYGKHYFSTYDVSNGGGTMKYKLFRFLLTPTGTGNPILGVYETQTQLFSKKITIKQIRLYVEPTATGNGIKVDCIGSDGTVITNSMTNTYTFASGTDVTKLQGALERIDFNPVMKDTFALGLRLTNTGTTNMIVHKVEVDYQFSGK